MALPGVPFARAATLLGAEAAASAPSDWPALRDLQLDDARQLRASAARRALLLLGAELSAADYARVRRSARRASLPGEMVAVPGDRGELRYARVVEEDARDAGDAGDVKVQVSRACIRWYASSRIRCFPSALSGLDAEPEPLREEEEEEEEEEEDVVGAVNVAAAVDALLAKVNLSLGASLHEVLAELQRQRARAALAEQQLRAALRRAEVLARDKHRALKALACAVCLDRAFDRALEPCGHAFCAACVRRLQPAVCPVCRQQYASAALVRIP